MKRRKAARVLAGRKRPRRFQRSRKKRPTRPRAPAAAGAARSTEKLLVQAARDARDHAFAPFSRFKVGSAVRSRDGRIFSGCNIENASFSLTLCAERVAIFKAISEGAHDFTHVTIVTDAATLTPPCGACRQVLWEFAPHAEVILANVRGRTKRIPLAKLLPSPFDSSDLDG